MCLASGNRRRSCYRSREQSSVTVPPKKLRRALVSTCDLADDLPVSCLTRMVDQNGCCRGRPATLRTIWPSPVPMTWWKVAPCAAHLRLSRLVDHSSQTILVAAHARLSRGVRVSRRMW